VAQTDPDAVVGPRSCPRDSRARGDDALALFQRSPVKDSEVLFQAGRKYDEIADVAIQDIILGLVADGARGLINDKLWCHGDRALTTKPSTLYRYTGCSFKSRRVTSRRVTSSKITFF
jgi:hypothetical protein